MILQVTPIVAIAPLILIYVDNTYLALLICAWIVAFFPLILSNTRLWAEQSDHNLRDLFEPTAPRAGSSSSTPPARRHALLPWVGCASPAGYP